MNQIILSNPGIGRYSPTMARRQDRRRVSKDQLALAVRKNFNSLAIHESEVIVDFIYSVKHQGKCMHDHLGMAHFASWIWVHG